MDENLADVIVISVMWLAAAAGSIALGRLEPFVFALMGTVVFTYFSRH